MRKIIFLLSLTLTCAMSTVLTAQANADSLSFETQRKRVNNLLEERSKRFGDFTNSLEKKTGAFGLFKTKSDMQKSIDILKSVVINDNAIFLETRKLLDIKDNESERNRTLAREYDQQVTAYMKTISKLQFENEQLREKIRELKEDNHQVDIYLYIGIVLIAALGITTVLYKKRKT